MIEMDVLKRGGRGNFPAGGDRNTRRKKKGIPQ